MIDNWLLENIKIGICKLSWGAPAWRAPESLELQEALWPGDQASTAILSVRGVHFTLPLWSSGTKYITRVSNNCKSFLGVGGQHRKRDRPSKAGVPYLLFLTQRRLVSQPGSTAAERWQRRNIPEMLQGAKGKPASQLWEARDTQVCHLWWQEMYLTRCRRQCRVWRLDLLEGIAHSHWILHATSTCILT